MKRHAKRKWQRHHTED